MIYYIYIYISYLFSKGMKLSVIYFTKAYDNYINYTNIDKISVNYSI